MHRFFVPEVRGRGLVELPTAETRHATRVLRLSSGESVTILDGQGGEFLGRLEVSGSETAHVRIESHRQHPTPETLVTLIQSVAKGPAMEGLIHRAVELGCGRLVPVISEHSVSRPDSASDKQSKWQSIAVEAAKQSGNPWRMTVELPESIRNWIARKEAFELLLVASLEAETQPPHVWLEEFYSKHQRAPRTMGILIGPEGDFSPSEYEAFRRAGARPFSLGPRVLRVETAATAALAVLQSLLCVR
ncbi:MAG TPA: RsmE family RNA methyltransferase [Verrucomicrobiota bacterium]|nr:RsmE family RNA methyltransferase [Verrucomicrobiota bacterium]